MNNEPVAWLWMHKGITMNVLLRNPMSDEYGKKHFLPKGWSSIPLYIHPVKCIKCNDTEWVCENHPDQEAHKCIYCGGAGKPCECTHPRKELNVGNEPVKNATYWKRQYNLMATQNDNLKLDLYHANEQIKYLESHPVKKELTDEEIWEVVDNCFAVHAFNTYYRISLDETREDAFELVKAILREASEK